MSEIMNVSNIYVTGIISPIKRKSLPEIAQVVGINSPQSLHHFIANSPWSVEELKKRRLSSTKKALNRIVYNLEQEAVFRNMA